MTPDEYNRQMRRLKSGRRLELLLSNPSENQPTLSVIFPLFLGLLASTLPTTLMMLVSDPVVPWRWVLQGTFITIGLVGSLFGWRARRAWRRRTR